MQIPRERALLTPVLEISDSQIIKDVKISVKYVLLYKLVCRSRGLGMTSLPRDPRFAGSIPAEIDNFFQDVKIQNTSPPGGTLSRKSRVWDFRLVKELYA